ncbi:MAG TPA: hypothetical protein VNH11_08620 [Pirellulales bacterium]|nr:hypothetical protein [Pirellulales bacterium]
MKVLFVGEGPHDVGSPNRIPGQPRPAGGTIPTLTRRVCDRVAPDSIAITWSEIPRFHASGKKRGFPAKIMAAVLLSMRSFGCAGTIAVADRDGKAERNAELEAGVVQAQQLFPGHAAAWGTAVESIEAWTLGAPQAIAEELEVDVRLVEQQYPAGVHVEASSETSGKLDHRPKRLIERLAQLKHRHDSAEFRAAVAERTDVDALAQACPQGFAPFAERIRRAFGPTTV